MCQGLDTMDCSRAGNTIRSLIASIRISVSMAIGGLSSSTKFQGPIKGSSAIKNLLLTLLPTQANCIVTQEVDHQCTYYILDASWPRGSIQ